MPSQSCTSMCLTFASFSTSSQDNLLSGIFFFLSPRCLQNIFTKNKLQHSETTWKDPAILDTILHKEECVFLVQLKFYNQISNSNKESKVPCYNIISFSNIAAIFQQLLFKTAALKILHNNVQKDTECSVRLVTYSSK